MQKMLLHACCGPCSIYPLQRIKGNFEVTSYFFNPNIHPYKEFTRRLQTLREYSYAEKLKLEVDKTYCLEEFLGACLLNEDRCEYCYKLRMTQTAKFAKDRGFDVFCTTLLVSPFQNHEMLVDVCEQVAQEVGIPFHYEDYREGFEIGKQFSKDRGMYNQGYCGCIFSERDRYERRYVD